MHQGAQEGPVHQVAQQCQVIHQLQVLQWQGSVSLLHLHVLTLHACSRFLRMAYHNSFRENFQLIIPPGGPTAFILYSSTSSLYCSTFTHSTFSCHFPKSPPSYTSPSSFLLSPLIVHKTVYAHRSSSTDAVCALHLLH